MQPEVSELQKGLFFPSSSFLVSNITLEITLIPRGNVLPTAHIFATCPLPSLIRAHAFTACQRTSELKAAAR